MFQEGDDVIALDPTDVRSEHYHMFLGFIDEVYDDGTYLVRDQDDNHFIIAECDLVRDSDYL